MISQLFIFRPQAKNKYAEKKLSNKLSYITYFRETGIQ